MEPRPDDELLAAPGDVRRAVGTHAAEVAEGAADEEVEPATKVVGRRVDARVGRLDVDGVPISVARRVIEPLEVVGRDDILGEGVQVTSGQVSEPGEAVEDE